MDEKLISKIQKLLNLSESSNVHEAEVSMLKAQELLAKYKLSLKEVKDFKIKNSKIKTTYSNVTFKSAKWKGELASLIADNFGCYCYFKVRGTNIIVFLGREEDIEICNIVLDYAIDSVESATKRIKYQYNRDGYSTKGIVNDYAIGFIEGLNAKFEEQKRANQEWGLVLVKDAEVTQEYKNINFTGSVNTNLKFQGNSDAYEKGMEDGENFSISDRITEGKFEEQLTLGSKYLECPKCGKKVDYIDGTSKFCDCCGEILVFKEVG